MTTFSALLQRLYGLSAGMFLAVMCVSLNVLASPGAHGPDGEHLDTQTKQVGALNPGFESFTDTFEIMGTLLDDQLVVYLHDFKTNVPISGATVEIETGSHSATASYNAAKQHYVVSDTSLLETLQQSGEHHLVLTIITEEAGDLLSATLRVDEQQPSSSHQHEHAHFPWWILALCLVVFGLGFWLGRQRRSQS